MKWGVGDNPEMGDAVKVTVLASGFDLTLSDMDSAPNAGSGEPWIFHAEEEKAASVASQPSIPKDVKDMMTEMYGAEKLAQQTRDAARNKYAVLHPDQFDDHDVIAAFERTPTFNRSPKFNEELKRLNRADTRAAEPHNPQPRREDTANQPGDGAKIVF